MIYSKNKNLNFNNMKPKHDLHNLDGHFNTRSGLKFSIFNPSSEMIDITDISHGLSYKCHFGGQTPQFFSIAQHCLLVVDLLPPRWRDHKPEIALSALLHDAAEAYIGDMIKPLKIYLPKFNKIEDNIIKVIFEKYNLNIKFLNTIKPYDLKAQEIEFAVFFEKKHSFNYLTPEQSVYCFTDKFYDLYNKIKK